MKSAAGPQFGNVTVHLRECVPSLWWLLVLLVLFVPGQRHGVWGSDEPREAAIAREMYISGDWVTPTLNGSPFYEKPPLTYWGAAAAFDLTILAAFVLATSVEWIYISHLLLVDVPLAASVILALALFWYGYRAGGQRKRFGYIGCMIAAGGAFLAKGTVGVVIPASAIAAFLILRREWREIARLLAPWNILVLAAVTLPWIYLLAEQGGGRALHEFIWRNQVLRFFSPAADHAEPPWYYLPLLFEILAPWVIFLPPALYRLFRPCDAERRMDAGRQFLLAVIVVPFVLLSIASGKRQLYLLPLMPGFAIAIAIWCAGVWCEAPA
ncbi:MAG: glycosyltransferase family 39 protein, partial [Candidatus Aureabacteria bacterium]|nr:glycosyltransferase family 39 protein [Candidatus Auribacterota bacterium]